MANDIHAVNSGEDIKHGIALVKHPGTGYDTLETDVINIPTIETIQDKYDNRFDDKAYYVS